MIGRKQAPGQDGEREKQMNFPKDREIHRPHALLGSKLDTEKEIELREINFLFHDDRFRSQNFVRSVEARGT